MSTTISAEAARMAAKWWADQLRNGYVDDNGDHGPNGMMGQVLSSMVQASRRHLYTKEAVDKFEGLLAELIQATAHGYRLVLDVDYHPGPLLYESLEGAGLPTSFGLPCKTTMIIMGAEIKVSAGYGAPYTTLGATEDQHER